MLKETWRKQSEVKVTGERAIKERVVRSVDGSVCVTVFTDFKEAARSRYSKDSQKALRNETLRISMRD